MEILFLIIRTFVFTITLVISYLIATYIIFTWLSINVINFLGSLGIFILGIIFTMTIRIFEEKYVWYNAKMEWIMKDIYIMHCPISTGFAFGFLFSMYGLLSGKNSSLTYWAIKYCIDLLR